MCETRELTEDFVRRIPKAELHLHIEGTLEPELAFTLARRNGITLPDQDPESLRQRYEFDDLSSFLAVYYDVSAVLVTEQDFAELASAYLARAAEQGVVRAEIFFDPQTHTARGVPIETVIAGLSSVTRDAEATHGVSAALIMCFLRDLGPKAAAETLESALPYADQLLGIGLDSAEVGHPPAGFAPVYERARAAGLRVVAHAGEEGPPEYVVQALDVLGVERVDHGIRSMEDGDLLKRIAESRVPLTVCPLSNVKLRCFDTMDAHALPAMLAAGLNVSLHSDDPAFFGGYAGDNYVAAWRALQLPAAGLAQLARNSFESAFLPAERRAAYLAAVDDYFS